MKNSEIVCAIEVLVSVILVKLHRKYSLAVSAYAILIKCNVTIATYGYSKPLSDSPVATGIEPIDSNKSQSFLSYIICFQSANDNNFLSFSLRFVVNGYVVQIQSPDKTDRFGFKRRLS